MTGDSMNQDGAAQTVVVVGAGETGGSAVATLREEGHRGRLVLVGAESRLPYGRPPLSKGYLLGTDEPWWVRPDQWYSDNSVELRLGTSVVGLDTKARRLALDSGDWLDFDKLLIATGGRNRSLQLPGSDLDGLHSVRTIEEAEALMGAATAGSRAVVIGMGFMGCELAASLIGRKVEVTAVYGEAEPLERVLGPQIGGAIARLQRAQGVHLSPLDSVIRFEGNGHVQAVVTKNLGAIPCDLVVVAVGIALNLDPLGGSDLAVSNGILVDERCQTSVPGIFAAGDIANHLHPLFGRIRVEHFNNAEKQGRAAALNMLGADQPYDYVHTFWSDQYTHKLEYVGHAASWDQFVVRGDLDEGKLVGFYLARGRLLAAVGLDRGGDPEYDPEDELGQCQRLIGASIQVDPAQLADEAVELKSLFP